MKELRILNEEEEFDFDAADPNQFDFMDLDPSQRLTLGSKEDQAEALRDLNANLPDHQDMFDDLVNTLERAAQNWLRTNSRGMPADQQVRMQRATNHVINAISSSGLNRMRDRGEFVPGGREKLRIKESRRRRSRRY